MENSNQTFMTVNRGRTCKIINKFATLDRSLTKKINRDYFQLLESSNHISIAHSDGKSNKVSPRIYDEFDCVISPHGRNYIKDVETSILNQSQSKNSISFDQNSLPLCKLPKLKQTITRSNTRVEKEKFSELNRDLEGFLSKQAKCVRSIKQYTFNNSPYFIVNQPQLDKKNLIDKIKPQRNTQYKDDIRKFQNVKQVLYYMQ